jgi:hypothetical protein
MQSLLAVYVSLATLIASVGASGAATRSRGAPIDAFAIGDLKVEVYFFEPTSFIRIQHPEFTRADVSSDEKGKIWLEYLHHSPIYLFSVRNASGAALKQFCIRGDPKVQGTASFYKVVIMPGSAADGCDPNAPEDPRIAEKTMPARGARGTMFESMAPFQKPENKKYIGNGIMLFGKYDRVTPYSEVKDAMVKVIRAEIHPSAL